jgi:hypothetical protein
MFSKHCAEKRERINQRSGLNGLSGGGSAITRT